MHVCMNIPQVEDNKCLAKDNCVGPLRQVKLSGYACSAYKSKINVLYLYLFCRQRGERSSFSTTLNVFKVKGLLTNKFADIATLNINA